MICRSFMDWRWNKVLLRVVIVEPSGVQALKNPNPLKDVQDFVVLGVAVLV